MLILFQKRASTISFFLCQEIRESCVFLKSLFITTHHLQAVAAPMEECSSSESGWTMYIASSPDHEHSYDEYNHEHGAGNKHRYEGVKFDNGKNNESDDSMNSDASSGPSHQEFANPGFEQKVNRKCTSKNQQKQGQKKQSKQSKRAPKEDPGGKVNTATKLSDGRSLFRRNK